MSDLVLFFLRYGEHEPDDILRVRRLSSSQFRITYVNGEDRTRASHLTTREGATGYLWTLLYAISVDTDPFRYVQLCGIGFPSMMVSISELDPGSATWVSIFTIMHTFLDQRWDVTPVPIVIPRARSRRTVSGAQNNRSSSVPQSAPASDSRPSQQEPVNPPPTEWGGAESRTTEPS